MASRLPHRFPNEERIVMRLHPLPVLCGALCAFALAPAAHAVTYQFTVSGDYAASFRLDASPVVDVLAAGVFVVRDVAGTFAGAAGLRDVSFYTPDVSGGMAISQRVPFVSEMSVFGAQVFSGPIDAPLFAPGSYDFTGYVGPTDGHAVRLVISAVPEPAAWALLAAGMAVLAVPTLRARPRRSPRSEA
jgi:hypothetical protein